MKNITLSVLIGILILNACNPTPKVTNYPINADLKAAFYYQIGTYWIYRDSISGMIDSFYVTTSGEANQIPSNGSNYSVDNITIQILEKNISPVPTSSTLYCWDYFYQANIIFIDFFFDNNSHPTEYRPFINYPFQATITTEFYAMTYSYLAYKNINNIYNNYVVNGNSFTNVAEINHWVVAPIMSYNDVFFISPEAGIIKMRLNHPLDSLYRVWELQRWHIVK